MSWSLVSLSKLVEKINTWNPRKEVKAGVFKYIDLSSVDKVAKIIDPELVLSIETKEAPSRARQLVEINDVLVATVRPNLNGVAIVDNEIFSGATASTGYCVLRPIKEKLDSKYLYFWVKTNHFINLMVKLSSGANYPAVSDKIIKNSKIPLPPLNEQKRIATILDKADAIRRKRQQAIDLTDQLLRSVFLDMFGDPVTNNKNWDILDLNLICTKVTDGTHDTPKRVEEGIPYITGKHIRPFKIDFENSDFVDESTHNEIFRRCNPQQGDVLYTNIGVNLGTAALNTVEFEFSMKNVALLKLDKEKIVGDFLVHLLNESRKKDEIKRIASLGGAQGFLSLKDIKALKVFVPPIELQNKFVKIVEESRNSNSHKIQSEDLINNLFAGLTQQAFKGELSKQTEAA